MTVDLMDYAALTQNALRGVIRQALLRAASKDGLPGEHHFYITFLTRGTGVSIPEDLLARYPYDITIVLQHQFRDLRVTEDFMRVTLTFGGVPKILTVPFAAITRFHDPYAQFMLEFEADDTSALTQDLDPTEGSMEFPAIVPAGGRLRGSRVRQQIAYVPQELPRWYGSLKSNLHYEAAIHGIRGADNEREVNYIVERLGLGDELNKRWRELAGGFKLRFALARALVWKPKLLVLDEPLANLDFTGQQVVLKDLRNLTNSIRYPLAVLISSQHLHEIEEVSDDILFLRRGEVAYSGPTAGIGRDRTRNTFELGGGFDLETLQRILDGPEYLNVYHSGVSYVVKTTIDVPPARLMRRLLDANLPLDYFRDISQSTKSLFEEESHS